MNKKERKMILRALKKIEDYPEENLIGNVELIRALIIYDGELYMGRGKKRRLKK